MPMSEDALQWARQHARKKYQYPDDRLAIADLLKRWNIPLEMSPAERRIALRLNQSQSWLAQALTTADQPIRPALATASPDFGTPSAGRAGVDNVIDSGPVGSDLVDSDDHPPADDDDFYADAWDVLQ